MKKAKKVLTLVACAVLLVCISVGATLAYLTSTTETVTNTFTVGNVEFNEDANGKGGLDEEDVDIYGKDANTAQQRVTENEYKLLPGHTYIKDPTLHISNDSEACYARAIVTVTDYADLYAIVTAGMSAEEKAALSDEEIGWLISQNVGGFNTDVWYCKDVTINSAAGTIVYEFRVKNIVVPQEGLYVNGESVEKTDEKPGTYGATDAYDIVLFEKINVPAGLTNEQLATLAEESVTTKDDQGNETTTTEPAMQIKVEAHLIQADGFTDEDKAWEAFSK